MSLNMSVRKIIILIIVLTGTLFLLPSNPYTDIITKPIIRGLANASSYLNDKNKLPVKVPVPVEKSKVYKWQDKHGNWHFSNTKPPKDVAVKTEVYRSDTNIVPALEPKK